MRRCPLLIEVNLRSWLRDLALRGGGAGTLADVPAAELARWQRLGCTHLWLMGAWGTGPRARQQALASPELRRVYDEVLPGWQAEDVAGSPYAIEEYRVPDELGGETGLARFREELHAHGLKLLLDFVPNHVGRDHRWVREQPELFVVSPEPRPGTFRQETSAGPRWLAHGKDPNSPAWSDTVQLDYRRPATRAAMLELLRSVAGRCDGVRCDLAMLVLNDVFARTWEKFPTTSNAPEVPPPRGNNGPVRPARSPSEGQRESPGPSSDSLGALEFWSTAISTIKAAWPDFLFLAEAYWGLESKLQGLGFDYTYDKELYDKLMARDTAAVQGHLLGLGPERLAAGAHFLENHDEPRVAARLSLAEHRAAALLILALPGMRFLHEGQLAGARRHLPVQLSRRPAEPAQTEIEALYEQLLTTLPATALGRGTGELLAPRAAWPGNPTGQNLILAQWQSLASEFDLAAVNLAPHSSQCFAPLTIAGLAAKQWEMKDLLGPEAYTRCGKMLQGQGLYLDLPGLGARLFHFRPAE